MYEGQFIQNMKQGDGMCTFSDGSSYKGSYFQNKRHGFGEIIYANGLRYEGQWINDMQEGQGILKKQSGDQLVGTFKENVLVEGKQEFKRLGQARSRSCLKSCVQKQQGESIRKIKVIKILRKVGRCASTARLL